MQQNANVHFGCMWWDNIILVKCPLTLISCRDYVCYDRKAVNERQWMHLFEVWETYNHTMKFALVSSVFDITVVIGLSLWLSLQCDYYCEWTITIMVTVIIGSWLQWLLLWTGYHSGGHSPFNARLHDQFKYPIFMTNTVLTAGL